MKYDPDGIGKDSQDVRIYCNDNPNKLDTKQCHSYSSQLQCGFTAYERQAWTNYENNGNYLVVAMLETLFVLSIQIFEGQYFLYEGGNCKLIALHFFLQCLSMLI